MTREEQLAIEAKRYYPDDINCYDAFLHGVKWERKHRANVWHDVSEEPRYEEFLLAEESSEFNVYKLSGQKDNNSWELLVSAMGIIRWAYIDDLLPKQFGNSEQLKRDEKMIWFLVIMLILLVCGMMKDSNEND